MIRPVALILRSYKFLPGIKTEKIKGRKSKKTALLANSQTYPNAKRGCSRKKREEKA